MIKIGFYETLSDYYDKVFPLSNPCKSFIEKQLTKTTNKLLDVGCSTGELDIFLGEKGYNVLGIDLDNKMIQMANDKINNREIPVQFKAINMENLQEDLSGETFDGIISIGNTLVHLTETTQIKEVLKQMAFLLNPQGVLIIQIINYDRIITQNVTHLPTIRNENISFIREYEYDENDNKVLFKTVLNVINENKKYENEISLFPLRYETLKSILLELGLKNIQWYGNFNGDPYEWDSYATIVTAQK